MALQASSSYIHLISKIIFVDLDVDVEDVKDILIVKSQQINASAMPVSLIKYAIGLEAKAPNFWV